MRKRRLGLRERSRQKVRCSAANIKKNLKEMAIRGKKYHDQAKRAVGKDSRGFFILNKRTQGASWMIEECQRDKDIKEYNRTHRR
jgi:hypothetical protein